jgi:hypothetical protein
MPLLDMAVTVIRDLSAQVQVEEARVAALHVLQQQQHEQQVLLQRQQQRQQQQLQQQQQLVHHPHEEQLHTEHHDHGDDEHPHHAAATADTFRPASTNSSGSGIDGSHDSSAEFAAVPATAQTAVASAPAYASRVTSAPAESSVGVARRKVGAALAFDNFPAVQVVFDCDGELKTELRAVRATASERQRRGGGGGRKIGQACDGRAPSDRACASVCEFAPACACVCLCVQVCARVRKRVQVCAMCKCAQVCASVCKCAQVCASVCTLACVCGLLWNSRCFAAIVVVCVCVFVLLPRPLRVAAVCFFRGSDQALTMVS